MVKCGLEKKQPWESLHALNSSLERQHIVKIWYEQAATYSGLLPTFPPLGSLTHTALGRKPGLDSEKRFKLTMEEEPQYFSRSLEPPTHNVEDLAPRL